MCPTQHIFKFLFAFMLALPFQLVGQNSPPLFQSQEAVARVKLLHQFINRFNASENIYGKSVTEKVDQELRKKYLASLFESEFVAQADRDLLLEFIGDIVCNDFELNYRDKDWYAKTVYAGRYKGVPIDLEIVLNIQQNPDNSIQWVIQSAYGPSVEIKQQTQNLLLEPNANELNFISLNKGLQNPAQVRAFTSKQYKVDHLSILLFLIQKEEIKLSHAKELSYHFLQVPDWQFSVKEFNKSGYNSGWLIYDLRRADTDAKKQFRESQLYLIP